MNYLADFCEKRVYRLRTFPGLASFTSNYLRADPSVGRSVVAWECTYDFIREIYVNINGAQLKISVQVFREFDAAVIRTDFIIWIHVPRFSPLQKFWPWTIKSFAFKMYSEAKSPQSLQNFGNFLTNGAHFSLSFLLHFIKREGSKRL